MSAPRSEAKGWAKSWRRHHRGGSPDRLQAVAPGYGRARHAHSRRDVPNIRLPRNRTVSGESHRRCPLHGAPTMTNGLLHKARWLLWLGSIVVIGYILFPRIDRAKTDAHESSAVAHLRVIAREQ